MPEKPEKPEKPEQLRSLRTRVGVSTISFRQRRLDEALEIIAGLGSVDVDLGAIPTVVDHIPVPFDGDPAVVAEALRGRGLHAGAVNADVGDLNDPRLSSDQLDAVARPLIRLAGTVGGALIVPAGRASEEPFVDVEQDLARIVENLERLSRLCAEQGVRLLVEVLHHRRFVHSVARAQAVLDAVDHDTAGLLFDVSHVVASAEDPVAWLNACGPRVERVHLRDAVPGDLTLGIGRGQVDFAAVLAALEASGFDGTYVLELETHDVAEEDREADAAEACRRVLAILEDLAGHSAPSATAARTPISDREQEGPA